MNSEGRGCRVGCLEGRNTEKRGREREKRAWKEMSGRGIFKVVGNRSRKKFFNGHKEVDAIKAGAKSGKFCSVGEASKFRAICTPTKEVIGASLDLFM